MKKQNGFTLIEMIICMMIGMTLFAIIGGAFLNTPGQTETRALENVTQWVTKQDIKVKRMSCAHDSDSDGYGSCTVVTTDNEHINLQCPAGYVSQLTGASSCKEVDGTYKVNQSIR